MQSESLTPAPIRTFAEIETLGPICTKMETNNLDENKIQKTVERSKTPEVQNYSLLKFVCLRQGLSRA